MTPRCDSCGATPEKHGDSMHTHEIVIGRKTFRWCQCRACELKDLESQDLRADEAIKQAEKAHV